MIKHVRDPFPQSENLACHHPGRPFFSRMAAQTQVDNIIGRLAALINLMAFGTLEHASNTVALRSARLRPLPRVNILHEHGPAKLRFKMLIDPSQHFALGPRARAEIVLDLRTRTAIATHWDLH